ncbi:MAG: hypothetical protein GY831_09020, partial [Delftia sp.]|nr:hypothetical protein [Delftia sp.]
ALAALWALSESAILPQAWAEALAYPAWRAFAFLPVTIATAAAGLWVERTRGEGSPFDSPDALWQGWSRPLHLLLVLDLLVGQIVAAARWEPGTLVSIVHALTFTVLAVVWAQPVLPYFGTTLGLLAVIQRLFWVGAPGTDAPVAFALLALGYGLLGYRMEHTRTRAQAEDSRVTILERPL